VSKDATSEGQSGTRSPDEPKKRRGPYRKKRAPKLRGKKGTTGRPPHQPTEETIAAVERYVQLKYKRSVIADFLDIDEDTLAKHYGPQLRMAKGKLLKSAADALYLNILKGEQKAIEFALRMLGRGKDFEDPWDDRLALTGPDGRGLFDNLDLTKLSDEQFATLQDLLRSIGLAIPRDAGEAASRGSEEGPAQQDA